MIPALVLLLAAAIAPAVYHVVPSRRPLLSPVWAAARQGDRPLRTGRHRLDKRQIEVKSR